MEKVYKAKWIFNKHTKDMDTLYDVLRYLISRSDSKKESTHMITQRLKETSKYKPRTTDKTTTINNKINELKFYNLIYEIKGKYMISYLGNFYLEYAGTEKSKYIFLSLLFGIQFPHPYNRSISNLFPFRVIIHLLLSEKLSYKLYNDEIFRYIMNFEFSSSSNRTVRNKELHELENLILKSRKKMINMALELEKIDRIADKIHQWDYYVSNILVEQNVVEKTKISNERIKFFHPTQEKTKCSTSRTYSRLEYMLTTEIKEFATELIKESPAVEEVLIYNGNEFKEDIDRKISNYLPRILLNKLDNTDERIYFENLLFEVKKHSLNKMLHSPSEYEIKLEETFNAFKDIKAHRISGPGATDVECIYSGMKFNVEAKSTSNKLGGLNRGRIEDHMNKTKANYTLVIAPDFAPAVYKSDIRNSSISVLETGVFCEYVMSQYFSMGRENLEYKELHELIMQNLGENITSKVSERNSMIFGLDKKI